MGKRNAYASAAWGRKAGAHNQRKRPIEAFSPYDHSEPCPIHGITACLTCHEVAGECAMGGCTKKATQRYVLSRNGQIVQNRDVCNNPTCRTIFFQQNAGLGVNIDVEPLT